MPGRHNGSEEATNPPNRKIYLTGDTHGYRGATERLLIASTRAKEGDIVIILGDFGVIWDGEGVSAGERETLDWMQKLPFTIAFIDGNHENHARLAQYPQGCFAQAKTHRIRNNIHHIQRGEVMHLNGKSFLCIGGAISPDKYLRTPNINWWEDETPNEQERKKIEQVVDECGGYVDYVLTHTPPTSEVKRLCRKYKLGAPYHDEYAQYIQDLLEPVNYRAWFYGHMHIDDHYRKFQALYRDIVLI